MKVLMHYNPGLKHQVRHAAAFKMAGVKITTCRTEPADVHIVSGPHYALDAWRNHDRVLWLDRAFWGDPECITLGWLLPDGGRRFARGDAPRPKPELLPWKERASTALILADHMQDTKPLEKLAAEHFDYVKVRRHPADEPRQDSLESAMMLSDVVIGCTSTALVKAVILGRPAICYDLTNPVAPMASCFGKIRRPEREGWLHDLSWMQFNHDEIASGFALEQLGLWDA